MKCFVDNAGRTWTVAINVAAVKRVRALCGIDLANVITLEPGERPKVDVLERLASDPVLLVDVLFAICQPEAERKGVSDVSFGEGMAGDAIELATAALLDETVSFFPSAKRKVLEKIVTATRRFETKTKAALETALANPGLDASIDAELTRLTGLSTTSRASSE